LQRFKINACTAQHIGDRAEQQDRVAIFTGRRLPGALMAIVADGMGGRSGGRMASDQVISTAEQLFAEASPHDGSVRQLLETIASEAHTVIRLAALAEEKEPHSTLCVLVLFGGRAAWAHAGDTRLYHFRRGALLSRTADHTYVEQLRAEGRLEELEGAASRYKNILVSALGINRAPHVEITETADLQVGDTFLLASDGLWAYFVDEELGEVLDRLPPREASNHLIEQARQRARGRGDNLSLALVRLDEAPPRPRVAAPE